MALTSQKAISIINIFKRTDHESDDSDTVPFFKKRKICILDDSDSNNFETHNHNNVSKYIKIAEEDIYNQCVFNFLETPGPQHSLLLTAKPIEYFNLFFTPSFWTLIVTETNRYAQQFFDSQLINTQSRVKQWKPVTVLEMKAFIAVLFEMGMTRKPTIFSYWTENSRNIPWFRKMFSRNRFQLILKFFHLVNNEECFPLGHEKYNPCAKFDPVVQHANRVFKLHFTPYQQLCINESLLGSHCHSSTSQYLPNKKHNRCGVRFWMLYDAITRYCTSFCCYRNTKLNDDYIKIKKMGLDYNIAVKLLKESNYLNKGYHIFTDNFFTSTALAKYLFSQNTYLTGMIKKNRKDIPNEIKTMKVGKIKYFRNEQVLLCGYREKKCIRKPVLLISTKAEAKNMTVIKKRGGRNIQKTKPIVISSFNSFMGRVDESDAMSTSLDEHRTLKYWKKITFNIFTRMLLNSYIIYKESVTTQKMSRSEFISNIITEIEQEWMQEKENKFLKNEKKTYGLIKLPGRNLRKCVVCSGNVNGIRRSNLICAQCKKGLHALCFHKHECKNC